MLVANGVAGDSRVQKIAWSMAESGWEVTLLGRAPAGSSAREEYALGRARVLLLPVGTELSGYQKARLNSSAAARRRAQYRSARAVVAEWDAQDGGAARRRSLVPGLTTAAAGAARAETRAWLLDHPDVDSRIGRISSGKVGGTLVLAGGAVRGALDGHGGWRSFNPWFRDLELAFAPIIAELEPDLIHAHDFHMVGIGARAAARLSTPARPVRWVYDAHEYLAGIDVPGRKDVRGRLRRRMLMGVEREYIGRADAVVTVSQGIAERLAEDHRLRRRPLVVLNAPMGAAADAVVNSAGTVTGIRPRAGAPGSAGAGGGVRAVLGLPRSTPLMLYSGGMAPRRGVASAVRALGELPGVHLVLVAREDDPDVPALRELATRTGVAARLHTVPYVSPERVVFHIASADVGLIPILHRPNHELSLITKYFEYLHARLPIVCSDVREMARTTRELGVGEVYPAGDGSALAAAVRKVLAAPGRYRAAYRSGGAGAAMVEELTWERQAAALDALYAELLSTGDASAVAAREAGSGGTSSEPPDLTLRPVG